MRAVLFLMQLTADANVFAEETQERSLELGDDRIHFEHVRHEGMLATEGEELRGERGCATRGIPNFADVICHCALHAHFVQEQVAIAEDGGEEIIEVVRHAAGELAEGFHFLRARKLVMQVFASRDVHERPDELRCHSFCIANNQRAFEHIGVAAVGAAQFVFAAPLFSFAMERFAKARGRARAVGWVNALLPERDLARFSVAMTEQVL